MKIVFNDSSDITVQSVAGSGGYLKIKIIAVPREEILSVFKDQEKTCKMIVKEDRTSTAYERYKYQSLTEYDGAIYEVTMVQEGKSVEEIVAANTEEITATQEALCEVYEMIEGMVSE